MNLNKVFLIGRLTQNPEMKTLPSGQMNCTFGLATNRVWVNQQTKQKQEKAEFHNIVLWGRLAEIASQYLTKGGLVLVEGRIQTRSWQDPAGNKKYKTEIVADNIQMGPRTFSSGSAPFTPRENSNPQFNQNNQGRIPEIQQEEIPIIEEAQPKNNASTASNAEEQTPKIIEIPPEGDEEINIKDIPF